VLVLSLLAGAVVVGVRREDAAEAVDVGQLFGVGNSLVRGVVGTAGEDGDTSTGGGDGGFDDAEPLGLCEGGGFAGGACRLTCA